MPAKTRRSKKPGLHGAKFTYDHEEIRNWIEARNGKPAIGKDEQHLLRLRFSDSPNNDLRSISWGSFFARFEEENLAMVYQEMGDGGEMRYFCAFVSRS